MRPSAVTTMTHDAKGNLLTSTEQSIAATTSIVYEPVFNQVTRITEYHCEEKEKSERNSGRG